MPSLGNAILTLRVKGDEFKAGLSKAKTQAATTTKGIGQSFANVQKKIQGAAAKVPVFGGALAGIASPAGLAAAGIGLVVGGLTKAVGKTLDVGRRLGELTEKLGVGTDAIQIYERAIEEGNGKTGAFERTTLRLQKSIGDAAGGNKAAAAEFDKLGLSFEDLANKSPEEALRAVLGAANDTLGPTDKASVLAKTLGRSYADLGGFATKGADDLTAMLDGVKDVAVVMSEDGVKATNEYDTASRDMRDSFGGIVTEVGMALIPVLTQLFGVVKQAMPLIKTLIGVALVPLKLGVQGLSSAIKIVSALLRGDFTGALDFARNYFISVATIILEAGAKIVGLFNKDMADAMRGTVADLKALKVEAETETAPALNAVATATRKAGEEIVTTGKAAAAAIPKWQAHNAVIKTGADRWQDYIDRQNELLDGLSVMYPEVLKATEAIAASGAAAETSSFQLQKLTTGYMASMRALQALTLAKIEAENQRREDAYNALAGGDSGSDGGSGGSRNRPGGRPVSSRFRDEIAKDPITDVFTTHDGTPTSYSTAQGNQFPIYKWGRMADALAWLAANRPTAIPAAQHGAFVKGSQMGSLVRVGENYTDENITPVNSRSGGGNGQGGGGRRRYVIQLGEETLATLVLNAQNELVDEGRA